MKSLAASLLALFSTVMAVSAQETGEHNAFWAFGDWAVSVEHVDTGENIQRTCSARAGGDGDPTASITIRSGDTGPPVAFPRLTITERAPRGYKTAIAPDDVVSIWFDDEDVYDSFGEQAFDEDGFAEAHVVFSTHFAHAIILAMRKNAQMDVIVNPRVLHSFSLTGFTASYLKMMDQCGFGSVVQKKN